jgi:hypothetical protein
MLYHLGLNIECFRGKLRNFFDIVWDRVGVLFHLGFRVQGIILGCVA